MTVRAQRQPERAVVTPIRANLGPNHASVSPPLGPTRAAAPPPAVRAPVHGTGFLLRCWLALAYMRRFNYSRHLAWIKAQQVDRSFAPAAASRLNKTPTREAQS